MLQLIGNRVMLREHAMDDLEMVHQWLSDSEALKYLSWSPSKSKEETFIQLASYIREQFKEDRQSYDWALILKETGLLIGKVDLRWTSRKYGGGEGSLGYFLHRSHWGKGYAAEGVKLAIDFGFLHLGMHRITASCISENIASERVMQKCGMIKEAEFRKSSMRFGRWTNRISYAILREEWELHVQDKEHSNT